jgi:hypothetical protein
MTEEKLELQFERAELDHPAAEAATTEGPPAVPPLVSRIACAACGTNVRSYYSVNTRSLCRKCHDEAVASHRGLNLGPLLKALGLGLAAAALGALIYFGVAKITGYEIGLVSIVVGLLVGGAVKLGSGGRGGWRYQALAVGLCYLSIASSYGAFVVAELVKREEAQAAKAQAALTQAAAADPAAQPAGLVADGDAAPTEEDEAQGGPILVGALLLLVLKLPFLIGMESPMTFLLVGIALWEAWKLNVGQPFESSGPFAVGGGAPAAG